MFMSSSEESMFGDQSTNESTRKGLFIKGFLSAIYNPKGWLLLMSLYPTYIDYKKNLSYRKLLTLEPFQIFFSMGR